MASFCYNCGAALPPQARFCPECGAQCDSAGRTNTAATSPLQVAPDDGGEIDQPQRRRRTPFYAAAAAAAILAVVGGVWFGNTETEEPEDALPQPVASSASEEFYTVGTANIRDKPSLTGSKIVGELDRGVKVAGVLVAEGSTRQWLRLDDGRGFITLANLARETPPTIVRADGSDHVITGSCGVLAGPAVDAPLKITLKDGDPIKKVGDTATGYTEIGLPGGGVGYIAASGGSCMTTPSSAENAVVNTLVQFNLADCSFGPELAPYFDKVATAGTRESAEDETAPVTFPVQKVFHGLHVTSVVVGYEWHGIYFAEPAAKVAAVFRGLGHKIDKDGAFVSDDDQAALAAAVSATPPEERANGRSSLTCGV